MDNALVVSPQQKLEVKVLDPSDVAYFSGAAESIRRALADETSGYETRLDSILSEQAGRLMEVRRAKTLRHPFGGEQRYYFDGDAIDSLRATRNGIYDSLRSSALVGSMGEKVVRESDSYCRRQLAFPKRLIDDLDAVVADAHNLVSYGMHTPIGLEQAHREWQGNVPGTNKTEVLFGLYKRSESVSVHVSGSINESGVVEHPSFVPAHLPENARTELAAMVVRSFNQFSSSLSFAAKELGNFAPYAGVTKDPSELRVRIVNHAITMMVACAEKPESALYAMTLSTGMIDIKTYLKMHVEEINGAWYSRVHRDDSHLSNFLFFNGFDVKSRDRFAPETTVLGAESRPPRVNKLPAPRLLQ